MPSGVRLLKQQENMPGQRQRRTVVNGDSQNGIIHSLVLLRGNLVWWKASPMRCLVGVMRSVGLSPMRRTRAAARFFAFMMQPFLAVLLAASVAAVA